jgi:S-adenosylmethionine hydrolase
MPVITLLSDFGADSHYTASFRGALFKAEIKEAFVEISSRIEPFDVVEASFLCNMVYRDFPAGSIHVLASNVVATSFEGHLAAFYDGHYFLAPDNGILPLSLEDGFSDYYLIPTEDFNQDIHKVYVPFISRLLETGGNLDEIAKKADKFHTNTKLVPVNDGRELRGTVLFVDHFGNAYTNIDRREFEGFTREKSFRINLSKHEWAERISANFSDVLDGDVLAFFSSNHKLVIAIKKGNAEQLLGLRKYKPVIIELNDTENSENALQRGRA